MNGLLTCRKILDWMAKASLDEIDQSVVLRLLGDIENTVSLTNSFIDVAEFGLCDQCLIECAPRLDR